MRFIPFLVLIVLAFSPFKRPLHKHLIQTFEIHPTFKEIKYHFSLIRGDILLPAPSNLSEVTERVTHSKIIRVELLARASSTDYVCKECWVPLKNIQKFKSFFLSFKCFLRLNRGEETNHR